MIRITVNCTLGAHWSQRRAGAKLKTLTNALCGFREPVKDQGDRVSQQVALLFISSAFNACLMKKFIRFAQRSGAS